MWAYMLSFGALFGYATYGYTITNIDGTTDTGMIFVWVIMALVGSTLIGLKNRRIGDRRLRARINVTDLAVRLKVQTGPAVWMHPLGSQDEMLRKVA